MEMNRTPRPRTGRRAHGLCAARVAAWRRRGAGAAHPARAQQHGVHALSFPRLREPSDARPAGSVFAPAGLQAVRRCALRGRSARGRPPQIATSEARTVCRKTHVQVRLRRTQALRTRSPCATTRARARAATATRIDSEINRYGERSPARPGEEASPLNINGERGVGINPTATSSTPSISPPTTVSAATPARRPAARRTTCRRTSVSAASATWKGGTYPELHAHQHLDGLQPLRRPGVPEGLPDARLHQTRRVRRGDAGSGYLLRLRLLHLGVPVQRAAARSREGASVSKCNMCVDRLEVGLKPACVIGLPRQCAQFRRGREHAREARADANRRSRASRPGHHPPEHPLPADPRAAARDVHARQHSVPVK